MKVIAHRFVNYLLDFYGPGGIYTTPRDPFHHPMTADEARSVANVMSVDKDFEGDSIDREKARDLVLSWRDKAARVPGKRA